MRAVGAAPEAADRLLRFHELLASEALPRGFLGPRELDRLAERHVLEAVALATIIGTGPDALVDVGSGAGLPGVALACLDVRPVLLVEAEGRRAAFLEATIAELALRATVVRGRAEELGRKRQFRERCAVGVARALAAPPVALELVLPFVVVGGIAAVVVGETVDLDAAGGAARELGGGQPEVRVAAVPGTAATCRAMIVHKESVTPDRYPRRTGVPARRPLGQER